MKYRKKPVVVEAEQFERNQRLPFWREGVCKFADDRWYVDTLEGPLTISPGDFIIKGVKGEYYPCKPDIFALLYDAVAFTDGEQTHE